MADNPAQDAAAGLLDELAQFTEEPEETNEAPEVEGEQPQEEEAVELPEINWEVPAELQELLEAPDFDEDDEVDEFEGEGNVAPTFDEYDDPEKQQLAKQLAKMQKKLDWEKAQKVKAARKTWESEARQYFQFSAPETIQASSRRAFLKEAQRQHQAVAKVAKPVFDQLAEERKKIKEQALAEARAEAEERWGRPITGPTTATNLENTQTAARKRLESSRGLTGILKDKLVKGEVNL